MAVQTPRNRAGVRGNRKKAQLPAPLADVVLETTRLWRKHHLGYDQTKYVVEQARRRLKLEPPGARRRTVERLDKAEVERLIRNTYQSHSKYGLMILSGKSWLRTASGDLLGCHSRPPFLNSPTSSFFFVSTEMTRCPRC